MDKTNLNYLFIRGCICLELAGQTFKKYTKIDAKRPERVHYLQRSSYELHQALEMLIKSLYLQIGVNFKEEHRLMPLLRDLPGDAYLTDWAFDIFTNRLHIMQWESTSRYKEVVDVKLEVLVYMLTACNKLKIWIASKPYTCTQLEITGTDRVRRVFLSNGYNKDIEFLINLIPEAIISGPINILRKHVLSLIASNEGHR